MAQDTLVVEVSLAVDLIARVGKAKLRKAAAEGALAGIRAADDAAGTA